MLSRPAVRSLVGPLLLLAVTGCSGDSSGDAAPSPTASIAAGATCPTGEELVELAGGALGAAAEQTEAADVVCDGEWAAARVEVGEGLAGRVALRWDGDAWTPAFVGGAEGACPSTLRAAPDDIRQVMGC